MTLARISQAGHVGKTTCCAIFQKYTGETPVSYLTSYRLKKAAELLEGTDQPITDICMAVGFGSPQPFCIAFPPGLPLYAPGISRPGPGKYRRMVAKNRPQQV